MCLRLSHLSVRSLDTVNACELPMEASVPSDVTALIMGDAITAYPSLDDEEDYDPPAESQHGDDFITQVLSRGLISQSTRTTLH